MKYNNNGKLEYITQSYSMVNRKSITNPWTIGNTFHTIINHIQILHENYYTRIVKIGKIRHHDTYY